MHTYLINEAPWCEFSITNVSESFRQIVLASSAKNESAMSREFGSAWTDAHNHRL